MNGPNGEVRMPSITNRVLEFVKKHDFDPNNNIPEFIPAQNVTQELAEQYSREVLSRADASFSSGCGSLLHSLFLW